MSLVQNFPPGWKLRTSTHGSDTYERLARSHRTLWPNCPALAGVYTRWESVRGHPSVKVADIFDVSLDGWAGRKETNGDERIHNPELHRLYKRSISSPTMIKRLLEIVLDGLAKHARVSKVMAEL